ncbi:transposase [candidate division KSB1 bacterium]|nr:transposase [candidate division KSB1 bacterium]
METPPKTEQRKKLKRYDIPGHAHELTFSCYHRFHYLKDHIVCRLFIDELSQAREHFHFRLWAYVLMPNHVHLFIYPTRDEYKIATILQSIKGKTSKRYRDVLLEENAERYEKLCLKVRGKKVFRFWQTGGGFDRNLWNANAIHSAIKYIEHNPVRAGLVKKAEEWKWSSAHARHTNKGLLPEDLDIPILMKS